MFFRKFVILIWIFTRLLVPLAAPKVLSLEKTQINIWIFTRLFVPLHPH